MSITKLISAEELLAMGSDTMFELIEGELVEVSPSEHYSSEISMTLARILGSYVLDNRLGRLSGEGGGFILSRDPDTVVAPDIGFIRIEKAPQRLPRGKFAPFPPDLAIEIMSSSNSFPELARKASLYIQSGTKLVWVVDPNLESVVVFRSGTDPVRLAKGDALSGEEVLPGFTLPVADIFKDPLS